MRQRILNKKLPDGGQRRGARRGSPSLYPESEVIHISKGRSLSGPMSKIAICTRTPAIPPGDGRLYPWRS